jgi:hypothetical protein
MSAINLFCAVRFHVDKVQRNNGDNLYCDGMGGEEDWEYASLVNDTTDQKLYSKGDATNGRT